MTVIEKMINDIKLDNQCVWDGGYQIRCQLIELCKQFGVTATHGFGNTKSVVIDGRWYNSNELIELLHNQF